MCHVHAEGLFEDVFAGWAALPGYMMDVPKNKNPRRTGRGGARAEENVMSNTSKSSLGQLVASPRNRAKLGLAGVIASGVLALSLIGGGVAGAVADDANADAADATAGITATSDDATLAEQVAAKCSPSVGSVYGLYENGGQRGISQGSCVLIDAEGHLLTNYHVIENCTEVDVILNDTTYLAEVVGYDSSSDVAVLKIDAGDAALTPIEIGSSSDLQLGEWVMTLGTPAGEEQTVSQGIVSGLSRSSYVELDNDEAFYVGLIQTDAMINSGSSGGALVDSEGKLIGITTLNYTTSGDFAGMSYAIPIDYAMSIANQILEDGVVEHPQLGVSVADIMDAYYQGLYNPSSSNAAITGAYVASVNEGSGAAEAGIQEGDVITALDGEEVYSADDLIIEVRSHNIGDTVTLTVVRDGQEQDIAVTLGSDQDATDEGDANVGDDPFSLFALLGGESSEDEGGSDAGQQDGDQADAGQQDEGSSDQGSSDGWDSGWGSGFGWGSDYGYGSGYGDGWGWGGYGPGYGWGYGYTSMSTPFAGVDALDSTNA